MSAQASLDVDDESTGEDTGEISLEELGERLRSSTPQRLV